jgi:hypothetical protein
MYNSTALGKQSVIRPEFRIEQDLRRVTLTGRRFLFPHISIFNKSSIASCTFGALVDAALNKQVFQYQKNRGSGEVKEAWILEKASKFSPDGFGMPVLMDCGSNVYKVVEGHSRLQTILYMRQTGALKEFEDMVVPIQVLQNDGDLQNFMEVYRTTNANHGHTVSDKLSNSDYGFGKEIDVFLKKVENYKYKGIRIVRKDHIKQIALLLYGTTLAQPVSFQELQRVTKTVTDMADLLPHEFNLPLTAHNKDAMKQAFNFTLSVMKQVIDLTDMKTAAGKDMSEYRASLSGIGQSILSTAMFFSLLTWDKYSSAGDLTSIDAKRIAKNLVDKASWTDNNLSLLSAKKSMGGAIHSFFEIIRTKKKSD